MGEENRGVAAPGNAVEGVIFWMILLGGYSTVNGIVALHQERLLTLDSALLFWLEEAED